MFVVSLAALHLRFAVVVEFAGLVFDLGLTSEEHSLRAHNSGAAVGSKRGKDVKNERIISIACRGGPEARAAPKPSKLVFKPVFAEYLPFKPVLLLLVVCLLFRFQPPKLIGKR